MKLARIALTPTIAAISVFAFFSLTLSTFGAVVDEFPDHFVEWLGATGSQQIDTGYVFKTDPRVETTMMLTSGGDKDIMGTSAANDSCFIIDYKDSVKTIYYRYHASGSTQVKYTDSIVNKWVDVSFGSSISYDGSKLYVTPTADFSDNTSSFYLFYARTGMDGLKLKRVKMYDGGVLVRDFWPAVMANGTACMYDTITRKCHTNNKSGTFSVGATVSGFKQSCAVTVSAQNCTVSGAESGTYEGGASITVLATPDDGAIFSCWKGAPKGHTTDNPLTMRIEGDLDLQAVCIRPSDHSAALSVDGYTGSTTLQGFPVLVRISETKINGFSYSQCAADGRDLRFTSPDGATVYPHEIDTWNPDGVSTVWVRLPELKRGATFKIHWGGAPAASTASAVWGSAEGGSYVGVWHLNGDVGDDEPDSAKRDAGADLTAEATGMAGAMSAQMYSAASWTGRSRHLNASYANGGNYLKAPSLKSVFEGTTYSVSLWLNSVVVSGTTWNYLLANHTGASGSQGWSVKGIVTVKPQQQYWLYSDASNTGTGYFNVTKEWVHMVCTCDGKEQSIYVDGVLIKQATVGANGRIVDAPLLIGIEQENDSKPAFGGAFDELRFVGGAAMSADWVKAEYDTVANELFITETKTVWTGTAGGRFEDGANWSTGSAPAAGSPAVFEDDATYAVTFPEDFERANALSVTKTDGTTTFDTTGGSWTLPAAATYLNAQEHPVIFRTDAGNAFVVDQGETSTGVLKSEDGAFSFTGGATPKTTFASGLVNFYDPDGTTPTVLNTVVPNADIDAETEFVGGTSRLPNVSLAPVAGRTKDELRFTGGTNDIFGLVSVANRMALGNRLLLDAAGEGTVVNLKGGYDGFGSGRDEGDYKSFHSDGIRIADGATVTTYGDVFRTLAADFTLELLNGATLAVDSEYFSLGAIYDTTTPYKDGIKAYNTNTVTIVDSTLTFGPNVKRAWFSSYDPWASAKSYTALVATRSEINSAVEIRLNAGVYEFDDCTGSLVKLIAENRHADLIIDGGTLSLSDTLSLNNARCASLTNSVTFKAGNHVVNQIIVSQNDQGGNAAGILNVEGGTLTVPTMLRMSGNGATSFLNLSGGRVDVTGQFQFLHYGSGKVALNLTGGTLKVSELGKTDATLAFYANGGAIEASTNKKDLVPNNASGDYRLGPNGLIIRTDCEETTSSALFKDAEGEEGLLAKEGSGTLILTGTAFDFSAAEVRAGVLKFPSAATGVAFPATTVAGGTLDLSGSNGKPKFKSLTLGDGTVVGELKLDNASELVLEDFTPVSARITLKDPAADGTYGAFKVKGDQTDKLEFWQKTVADLPSGKQHVYTATYDDVADVTTFAITVQDQQAASGTAHWTGAQNSSWNVDGNWTDSAKAPTKDTTAYFESAGNTSVDVDGDAAAAGLVFDSYSEYRIGGSGSLTLSDGVAGEIQVKRGEHAVDVATVFKSITPISVEEGAALTLGGALSGDSFEKTGAGNLTLNGTSDFRYPMSVVGGELDLGNAAAVSGPSFTFGGHLNYTTAESGVVVPDTTFAGATNVVNVASDLTINGFSTALGSLQKIGAGKLKLNMAKDGYVAQAPKKDGFINLVEGELELVAPANGTFSLTNAVNVGAAGDAGAALARLVLTSADGTGSFNGYKNGADGTINVGGNISEGSPVKEASVVIHDMKDVYVAGFTLSSEANFSANRDVQAGLFVTNVNALNVYSDFSPFSSKDNTTVIRFKDIKSFSPTSLYLRNYFDLIVDNCYVSQQRLINQSEAGGRIVLMNGTRWLSRANTEYNSGRCYDRTGLHWTFDNATYEVTGKDQYGRVTTNRYWRIVYPERHSYEIAAGGLRFGTSDEADTTFHLYHPMGGEGHLTVFGKGTFHVAPGSAWKKIADQSEANITNLCDAVTMKWTGGTYVESGALALDAAAVPASAEVAFANGSKLDLCDGEVALGSVAGSPSVVNGTLAANLVVSNGDQMAFGDTAKVKNAPFRLTYAYSAEDVAAKTAILPRVDFGANPPSGVRVVVDLGNGEKSENPLVIEPGQSVSGVIATYTGADPDVSGWRVRGRGGIGVRGAITAANGEIRLTLTPGTGLQILVR